MLKNAPNLPDAIKFVNAAVSPELQANLPLYIDYGPGNPAAFKTGKIDAETRERIAELAGKCREAGADVGRLVGVGRRHSGQGALAQVHAVTVHASRSARANSVLRGRFPFARQDADTFVTFERKCEHTCERTAFAFAYST